MRRRTSSAALATALVSFALVAVAAPAQDAERFAADAAKRLLTFGKQCAQSGFPLRARRAWMEAVSAYAPDDPKLRQALGHLRVGSLWAPDSRIEIPRREDGSPQKAASLDRKWASLAKSLAEGHLRLAKRAREAGSAATANENFARALRFRPDLEEAGRALGWQDYDGVWGDAGEITALRRSRRIRQVVEALRRRPVEVVDLPADQQYPPLVRADIAHRGFRTAHFTVWGDLDAAVMRKAAAWAERAVVLCRTVFVGHAGYSTEPEQLDQLAFVREAATWKRGLEANPDLLEPGQLEFLLKYGAAAHWLGADAGFFATADVPELALDLAVRTVALDMAGMRAESLHEGVGHAFVGWCFGKSLIYMIDPEEEQPTGHTVVRGSGPTAPPVLPPDMTAWFDRAMSNAWTATGVRLADLPLQKVDRMPVDDRINAWSVCDYLLRREPLWLRVLTESYDANTPGEVASRFAAQAEGAQLADVEARWRQWWMEGDRLWGTAAGARDARPSASRRTVEQLVDAINAARHDLGLPWVGWEPAASPAVEFVARGAAQQVVERWMNLPAAQHGLIDPALDMVGVQRRGSVLAIDFARSGRDAGAASQAWPADGASIAPGSIVVAGVPELAARLKAGGHEATVVGSPLTLHVRGASMLTGVTCRVLVGGEEVPGLLVQPGEASDALTAPKLASFWPLAPLPDGATVEATWTWRESDCEGALRSTFTTR